MTRKRTAVLIVAMGGLLGLAMFASPVAAEKHGPPPQPLHQAADGHYTAWEAPTEVPTGSDVTIHTVVAGDWLSKIAQQYLGDWKLWPQIWEQNLWIKDSHWIYPGDKLVVKGARGSGDSGASTTAGGTGEAGERPAATAGAGGKEGAEGKLETASLAGEPILIGTEDDIYCFGYVDDQGEKFPRQILIAEETSEKIENNTGDIVFIDGGSQDGVKGGDEFFIVDPIERVKGHGGDGTWIQYKGRLKVLCAQERTATAEITFACDGVRIGSWLKPFAPIPVPIARRTPLRTRCDPSSNKPAGEIVRAKLGAISFGQDHMIVVDLGSKDGIKPGDFLTVFETSKDERLPRRVFGELGVLTVSERFATAKVLDSRQEMWVGLGVERSRPPARSRILPGALRRAGLTRGPVSPKNPPPVLGSRPTAGLQTLALAIGVRIPAPQPIFTSRR